MKEGIGTEKERRKHRRKQEGRKWEKKKGVALVTREREKHSLDQL